MGVFFLCGTLNVNDDNIWFNLPSYLHTHKRANVKVFAQYSAASINENGNSNGKSAQCNMFEQLLFRFAPHSATQFICLFRVERTKVYSQCFNRIFLKCETNTRLSRTKNIRFSTNLQNSCVATCHVFRVFCCVPVHLHYYHYCMAQEFTLIRSNLCLHATNWIRHRTRQII